MSCQSAITKPSLVYQTTGMLPEVLMPQNHTSFTLPMEAVFNAPQLTTASHLKGQMFNKKLAPLNPVRETSSIV